MSDMPLPRHERFFSWLVETLKIMHDYGIFAPIRAPIFAWLVVRVPKARDAYTYLQWLRSPPATPEEQAEKDAACASCPIMVKIGEKRYCGGCRCGERTDAELSIKNSRTYPHCPLGRQPGSVAIIQLPVAPEMRGEGI